MKRSAIALAGLMLAACSTDESPTAARTPGQELAPVLMASSGNGIPGHYIVVMKDGSMRGASLASAVADVAGGVEARPSRVFTAVLHGFAAELSGRQLDELRREPAVAYIEQDQVMTASATQSGATWGIDRIDQRSRPLSGTYTYSATASGVYAYVIDTGIYTSHSNFGGRASNVYDAFGGSGQDCNGHGTHVAGTIGSATYGVAKSVRLRGVRVLNCSGSGTTSGIIAGIDWVRLNRVNPAVANLSLGGGYSSSLNTAVTNLANSGVFVAVAAGNSNANACNYSPASASAVTTVASSTSSDAKSSFSNHGSCVDLYAPGSSITSTWHNGGTNTISGTSMASPHVAGVAALYKATYGNASQSTIDSWIKNNSTANVITGNVSGTPNRLLYKSSL
jgi:subtilisin family serine protease